MSNNIRPKRLPEVLTEIWLWAVNDLTQMPSVTIRETDRIEKARKVLKELFITIDGESHGTGDNGRLSARQLYNSYTDDTNKVLKSHSLNNDQRIEVSKIVTLLQNMIEKYTEAHPDSPYYIVVLKSNDHDPITCFADQGYGLAILHRSGDVYTSPALGRAFAKRPNFVWPSCHDKDNPPLDLQWFVNAKTPPFGVNLRNVTALCCVSDYYQIPIQLQRHAQALTERAIQANPSAYTGNGHLYRMTSYQTLNDNNFDTRSLMMIGQITRYDDHLATNKSINVLINHEGDKKFVWEIIAANKDVALDRAANPLSINVMFVLRDSHSLIINFRGRALENQGTYGPSISGMVKLNPEECECFLDPTADDLEYANKVFGIKNGLKKIDLERQIRASAYEELGSDVANAITNIMVIGYAVGLGLGTRAFMAIGELDMSEEQVLLSHKHSNRAETTNVEFVKLDKDAIANFINGDGPKRLPFLSLHLDLCLYNELGHGYLL